MENGKWKMVVLDPMVAKMDTVVPNLLSVGRFPLSTSACKSFSSSSATFSFHSFPYFFSEDSGCRCHSLLIGLAKKSKWLLLLALPWPFPLAKANGLLLPVFPWPIAKKNFLGSGGYFIVVTRITIFAIFAPYY